MSPPVVFFDLETRSKVDIKKHGAARYVRDPSTDIICIAARFPDGRKGVWAPQQYRGGLEVAEWLPDAWNSALADGKFAAAWNAGFDYGVMHFMNLRNDERGCHGLAAPHRSRVLCAEAQAENYSLPGKLGQAAAALRVPTQKDKSGAAFIRKFCNANNPWDPNDEQLRLFFHYALCDVDAMYEVWQRCRPWSGPEWADYHVVERVNERGMLFDVDFAEAASKWSVEETEALNERLRALTGDPEITLSHSAKKVAWLKSKLEGTDFEPTMMQTRKRKKGTVKSHSADKKVQAALLQRLDDTEELSDKCNHCDGTGIAEEMEECSVCAGTGKSDDGPLDNETRSQIREFIQVLEEGNGVATKKLTKVCQVHVDGRVHDQWRCSPTVTGRHASRGVQFDNVIRAKLPGEGHPAIDAMDRVIEGGQGDHALRTRISAELAETYGLPFQQVLARLIRPGIMAPEGKWIVWGDWSSIEARMLPWLAGAERPLEPYRNGTCVYSMAASAIFKRPWEDIYAEYSRGEEPGKTQRQYGKVATLAFGYQGGAGAWFSMLSGTGLRSTEEEAQAYKRAWREANSWAVRFWAKLDEAAWRAFNDGIEARAGRVRYRKVGRDLWCILPSGRPIVYPEVKAEEKYKEAWDAVVKVLTYRKIWQGAVVRGELYGGVLCENATQGAAACLLRELMRRLDGAGMQLIGSTHDEVRLESETPEQDAATLKAWMEENPSWAPGLPLKAEVEWAAYYGK